MLPEIEGLGMAEGLARLGGDSRMYGRLLLHFARQCEGTLSLFESALEAGDGNQLRRLAHKLKGVSGGLGAQAVEQSARDLELTADEHPQVKYQALSTSLREICARILCGLGNWPDSADPGSPLEISLPRLWEKLQTELQSFDGEALDSWSALSVRLEGRLPEFELERLNALVFGLDFPTALGTLRRLLCSGLLEEATPAAAESMDPHSSASG